MTQLIVALDFNQEHAALDLVDKLDPQKCAVKIGKELFTLYGPSLVRKLVQRQFKVFLDLKFHDIPHTVANACKAAADLGVWMLNVHAAGGQAMMETAFRVLSDCPAPHRPLLIAVTVLTSLRQQELNEIGINMPLSDYALRLALLAQKSGLQGVVSSAYEVEKVKLHCGANFLTVTPGIRFQDGLTHDQQRIMTPVQAIKAGSDFLVVGRTITADKHPEHVVLSILKDIEKATSSS